MSLRKAFGLSGSRVSIFTATTWKSGPPSFCSSASSVGISLRQGTHQVAHKFNNTVRPRQSARLRGLPLASWKERGGRRSGLWATFTAAPSPWAKGATLWAVSSAGRQALSPPALRVRAVIPYTPPSPTTTPARPPARIKASRFLAKLEEGRVGSVMVGKTSGAVPKSGQERDDEQQNVGRAICLWPRRHHGGNQRLHRLRPASLPARYRRVQGPCGHAGQARHHWGRRCEKHCSRSRHDPVRDRN